MLTKERKEKHQKVLDSLDGEANIIITHIDPDSMGAAWACLRGLENRFGEKSRISVYYSGDVGLKQNRMLFEKNNLDGLFHPIKDLPEDAKNIILLDSPSLKDSRLPENLHDKQAVIKIDHHKKCEDEEGEDQFFWTEVIGSTSTQITELIQEGGLKVELDNEGSNLAELLLMGIWVDTKDLDNAYPRDVDAFAYLYHYIKIEDLKQLKNPPLPLSYYENSTFAHNHFERNGARLVATAGILSSDKEINDPAKIADYFLKQEGVSLVVVCAILKPKVIFSARSSGLSDSLDETLKDMFGKSNAGAKITTIWSGEGAGLFKLDFGEFGLMISDNKEVNDKLVEFVYEVFKSKIFNM